MEMPQVPTVVGSEVLLQILLDNSVLLPVALCRPVCTSWVQACDSRRVHVHVASIPCTADGEGGGEELGRFLGKLPSLQSVTFAATFRKLSSDGVPLSTLSAAAAPAAAAAKRLPRRERGEDADPAGSPCASSEDACRAAGDAADGTESEDAAADGDAAVPDQCGGEQGPAPGRGGGVRNPLRELEQKRIDAACCALRAANVPAVSMSHSLQTLDHLGAVLQALSQGAAGGPRLCSLNLRGNWFKVEGAKMVAAALQGPLSGIWVAFSARARAFVALTRGAAGVTELDVSANDVTEAGLEALAAGASRLTKLTLGDSAFASGARAPRSLSQLLRACPALTSLQMTGDALRGAPFGVFFSALAAAPALEVLVLDKCQLGPEQGADVAGRLACEAPALRHLSLPHNELSSAVAEALVERVRLRQMVAQQLLLTRLDLSCNLLRAGGTAVLAQELRGGRGLGQVRHLDLSRNQMRASGCSELAHALADNAAVETLILHSNALQAPGATALADVLCVASAAGALTALDVSHNALDAAGVEALSLAVAARPQLQALNLSLNAASWRGLSALGLALHEAAAAAAGGGAWRGGAQLSRLDLSYNNASTPAELQGQETAWLLRLLAACPRLASVDLSYNPLGDGPALALAAALRQGPGGLGMAGCRRVGWQDIGLRGVDMERAALVALLASLSGHSRSALGLRALRVGDNPATEEWEGQRAGAEAQEEPGECDPRWSVALGGGAGGVSPTGRASRQAEAAASSPGAPAEAGALAGAWGGAGREEVSLQERDRLARRGRRGGFEKEYYSEQCAVWFGRPGTDTVAVDTEGEAGFWREGVVDSLLEAAGARALASHQICLDT